MCLLVASWGLLELWCQLGVFFVPLEELHTPDSSRMTLTSLSLCGARDWNICALLLYLLLYLESTTVLQLPSRYYWALGDMWDLRCLRLHFDIDTV